MSAKIYIGPAGWSYPDWAGVVYPLKKTRGFDPLAYLASYFNLIEINSTFYRLPPPSTAARWVERVAHAPEFRFTLKGHQDLTHARKPLDPQVVESFKHALSPLLDADRLLSVLLQFPWSFRNTAENRRRLEALIETLVPFPVAIEVRHGGWARDRGLAALAERGVTVCAVDQPLIGDSLSMRVHHTGEAGAYFRLHGRNKSEWFRPDTNRDLRYNYLYSPSELAPVADTVRAAAATASQVAVVLNNHFRGQAVANAIELKAMLAGARVAVPPDLLSAYPRLGAIASSPPKEETRERTGWLFDSPSSTEDDEEKQDH